MKKLLVLFLTISLLGCNEKTKQAARVSSANNLANDIIYIKDNRTGLCFAYLWKYHDLTASASMGFANVSCDKVEKLLENNGENENGVSDPTQPLK